MATAASPRNGRRTSSAKRRAQGLASFAGASLLTIGLWIGAPTSAAAISATSCSGLDTSCLTQSVRDDATEITRGARDAARDVGHEVDDTVDAVERVLGAPASSGIAAPGGGAGGDDGPGGGHDGRDEPQTRGNDHVSGPSGRSRTNAVGASRTVVVPILQPSVRPSIAQEQARDSSTGTGPDGTLGVGRIAADIGHRLALPLALLLVLVVVFIVMQSRLDRTDPELHLASLDEEVSRFR
jgi:hypothetical protein